MQWGGDGRKKVPYLGAVSKERCGFWNSSLSLDIFAGREWVETASMDEGRKRGRRRRVICSDAMARGGGG